MRGGVYMLSWTSLWTNRRSEKNYESAYNILMEYWDHFHDEEKAEIHKRLQGLGL